MSVANMELPYAQATKVSDGDVFANGQKYQMPTGFTSNFADNNPSNVFTVETAYLCFRWEILSLLRVSSHLGDEGQ
jgi:hypothetical protein